jgi:hypothetical protein|tara:strand:- start:1165 stop:1452 length:288 start_codon:yes stop_codon:yes gene_type:complete
MNLNKFYFTMTLILVTVLLINYVSAEEVYGDCKTIITTEVENGIEVSRNETRVCNETELLGEAPFDPDNNASDKMIAGMAETIMLVAFIAILNAM